MKHKRIQKVYKEESRAFYVALCLCVVMCMTYMYFLSESIVHVVMRKEVDGQISELASRISTLEADYIEKQHAVSNDIATLQGFVTADKKVFIDKSSDTLVLLRN